MKRTKIKRLCFVLLGLLVLIIAIKRGYSKARLKNPNPTCYTFEASIEQIRKSMVSGLGNYQMRGLSLHFSGNRDYYDEHIFNNFQNKNDGILDRFSDWESKVYFRFGKPLYYGASFHIHLDSISENKTEVEIFTLDPEIVTFGFGFGHFGYTWSKKVSPSTIEEYEILLAIGRQLGEQGMVECNYPKKWLKYQTKQQKKIEKQKKSYE